MLQYLKRCDWLAELGALASVSDCLLQHRLHYAHRLGANRNNSIIDRTLGTDPRLIPAGDQAGWRNTDVVKANMTARSAVNRPKILACDAWRISRNHKERDGFVLTNFMTREDHKMIGKRCIANQSLSARNRPSIGIDNDMCISALKIEVIGPVSQRRDDNCFASSHG